MHSFQKLCLRGVIFSRLQQLLLDFLDVFFGHHVIVVSHEPCLVVIVICDFADHLQEGRQLHLHSFRGAVDSQDRWVVIDVQESFNHEVLALVDETLSRFLDFSLRMVGILDQLYELTRRNLSLLLDFLAIDFVAHLVTVGECVVLAHLAQNVSLADSGRDERLL